MSLQKLAELAEEFAIKIAEDHYGRNEPKDVKAKDLDWIDEQTRQEITQNGTSEEYIPFDKSHNPPGAVASEKTWNRAKKAVKPYWKKYKEPWAVVMDIYKKMNGKMKKKKSSLSTKKLLKKYSQSAEGDCGGGYRSFSNIYSNLGRIGIFLNSENKIPLPPEIKTDLDALLNDPEIHAAENDSLGGLSYAKMAEIANKEYKIYMGIYNSKLPAVKQIAADPFFRKIHDKLQAACKQVMDSCQQMKQQQAK